ncbi:MAG TPA: hypothetical protein VKA90_05710 [Beijerinckiaceae bacterium]|nr:hypothetical protein [Beijerinckiaceae bacterium]
MRQATIISLLPALLASPALADGIYKDREILIERTITESGAIASCGGGRLFRRTNCSPDYVGSEAGLSKPSYYGTRVPDDGLPTRRW